MLRSQLGEAEERLTELYENQARTEDEMAARMDLVDRLRTQIHELEKDNRDMTKRYNEQVCRLATLVIMITLLTAFWRWSQTTTFEAERQSFYDNEQHLKSRILSLTQARNSSQQQPSLPPSPARPSCARHGVLT